ncbi:MAG: hypothetical protein GX868_04265 [Actinobacteria bacterium]|nr:hypothetical protein [Actinomycetota bacterium]
MARRLACFVVTAAVLIGGSACSGDDSGSDPDTSAAPGAPTKEQVASDASLHFPDSVTQFRLTALEVGQVDVSFQMDAADLDEFTSESGVELVVGQRVIPHSSPVWGTPDYTLVEFSGGSSTKNGVVRAVEVTANDKIIAAEAAAGATTTTAASVGATTPTTAPLDPAKVTVRISLTPAAGAPGTDTDG